jgi:hypothetical protein
MYNKLGKSILLLAIASLLPSCENKELFPPCGTVNPNAVQIQIVIHWDGKPESTLPDYMRLQWHELGSAAAPDIFDLARYGGVERLVETDYTAFCYDYFANNVEFRGYQSAESFEIYNRPRTDGLYSQFVPPLPNETTVEESNPPVFYLDARPQTVSTEGLEPGETQTLHFYPENVLREFTFMIYGVQGVKNISRTGGAISGMSASYFPSNGQLADRESTVLFNRIQSHQNAQAWPWTSEQKAMFAAKNPDWQSSDPDKGWTDDWITGRFSTFGPVNLATGRFRLTVDVVSQANIFVYGAWGYWFGQWEETVGNQIRSAIEGNGTGTPEERQQWWRARNGGYDILLFNDGRLVVPDHQNPNPDGSGGGFDVDIDEWDNVHVPIG